MTRWNAAREFVAREMFYIAIVACDVAALFLFSHTPKAEHGARTLTGQGLDNLDRIFNHAYLTWAQKEAPVLMGFLGLMAGLLLLVCVAGVGLLVWAIYRMARGLPVMQESPIHLARWSVWDSAKVLAVYVFLVIAGISCLSLILGEKRLSRDGMLLASFAVNYLALFGALILLWRVVCVERGQSLRAVGWSLPGGLSDLRRAVGCYAAQWPVFLAAALATAAIATRMGAKPKTQEIISRFMSDTSATVTVVIVVLACLVAPIMEEKFFRGFLQPALRNLVGSRGAIVLTALIFAGAHQSLSVFLPIFVLGLALGYVYEKTQSVIASATLHSIHNAMTTCFLLIVKFLPVQETCGRVV